jgi:uncharacterized protein YfiM (DUF2279 family)
VVESPRLTGVTRALLQRSVQYAIDVHVRCSASLDSGDPDLAVERRNRGSTRYLRAVPPSADAAAPVDDALARAWSAVEADWSSDDAHRRFLALCAASGKLSEAGRRYRLARDADPTREPEAKRRIDAILALATEQMLRQQTPRPEAKSSRASWVALGVALVIVGMTLWQLTRLR